MSKEHFEELLEETGRKVETFATETKSGLTEVGTRIDKLEAKLNRGGGMTSERKTIAAALAESEDYKRLKSEGLARNMTKRIELPGLSFKNTITSLQGESGSPNLGYDVAPQRHGAIEGRPLRRRRLIDALPVFPATSTAYEIPRNNSYTDNADYQASEGATKSESSMGFTIKSVPIVTIAHFLRTSLQVMEDERLLGGFVERVLRHSVASKLETELLSGNGQTRRIEGFIEAAPMIQVAGPTGIDRVSELLTELEVRDYAADAIVMHPRPWDSIRRTKDTTNAYLSGSFQSDPTPRLWGIPVIVTRSCPETRILAGNFGMGCALLERSGITVEMSRFDANNFTQNLVTVLAEVRAGLGIWDVNAFGQISIGGSP